MKRLYLILLALFIVLSVRSQRPVFYDKGIHSLRMEVKGQVSALPVLNLGSREVMTVSFDDMTHEYRRFTYRIEHVGADFVTDEGLFASEYMEADADELVVEDYQPSLNTSVLYTHYTFHLPNVGMRPLLSGNYRLVVQVDDENGDQQPAFETYFAVVEQKTSILLKGLTNTDVDHNAEHQQLEIELNYRALAPSHPERELKIRVMQNGRWDNVVEWPQPASSTGYSLKWNYCRDLLFKAGNEYRKFEQLSTRYPGMFVDNIRFFEPHYYATLAMNEPRPNYLYDEDQNGGYVYRSASTGNPDVEADYVWILFQLAMDPLPDADIYVDGLWASPQFDDKYKMRYNAEHKAYEALVFLKQGYYSYQYLTVPRGGPMRGQTAPVEGDYFQTENNYTVWVYYRPVGDRYDRLVGWRTSSYRPQ